MNWLAPFIFPRIKAAARFARGPNMSVRHIVMELHKQDQKTFARISPNTIDGWIDRSGPVPRWSDAVLKRAARGHEPGHTNGGRKGIFVSDFTGSLIIDSLGFQKNDPDVCQTLQKRVTTL